MKPLPDLFHAQIARSIDVDGVYPHQCLILRDGELTLAALMLNQPPQVYAQVGMFMRQKPSELIFGLDRFCKDGQGTTLDDCIAGGYWNGEFWRTFVIEYQHKPRIVMPLNWDNTTWNRFVALELFRSGVSS